MQYVSGLIYNGEEFVRGSLGFEDGTIKEINDKEERRAIARGIVVPNFFDAHVHIGDSVVREEVRGSVEEVFGPDGFKAKHLKTASNEDLTESMKTTLKNMLSNGISGFSDFRENGLIGLSSLYLALFNSHVRCVALGRPEKNVFDESEIEAILKISDGIGASSARDWDYEELKKISELTKSKGKLFALHASEGEREDIDQVLSLKPDFLVHMTAASDDDLMQCADGKVPIVVCPRSNAYFGTMINIPRMLEKKADLMLGTDNIMLNSPSLLTEMEFTYRISKLQGGLSCKDTFKIGMNARRFFKKETKFKTGQTTDFMVLDSLGALEDVEKDPYYHIVLRATETNIALVCTGEYIYTRGKY